MTSTNDNGTPLNTASYAGFVTLIKYGTIVSFIAAMVVVLVLAN